VSNVRYIVERLYPGSAHRWRNVGAFADPEAAGALFHRVAVAMRQGGLRVMRRVIGELGRDVEPPVEVYSQWAPRPRRGGG